MPTLIVHGDRDGNGQPHRLFLSMPDRNVLILTNASHAAYLNQPETFVTAVVNFVNYVNSNGTGIATPTTANQQQQLQTVQLLNAAPPSLSNNRTASSGSVQEQLAVQKPVLEVRQQTVAPTAITNKAPIVPPAANSAAVGADGRPTIAVETKSVTLSVIVAVTTWWWCWLRRA